MNPSIRGQESIEDLAAMDPTQTMPTSKRKKIRKARRQLIGYNPSPPEMCSNCAYYKRSLHANGEYFPPRCEKYLLAVEPHAVCNHWEDLED